MLPGQFNIFSSCWKGGGQLNQIRCGDSPFYEKAKLWSSKYWTKTEAVMISYDVILTSE